MKKKLVSLLTVSAMTMSMLVGCGSGAAETATQTAETVAETATEVAETATDTAQEVADTATEVAEAVTEEAAGSGDLADKKVGVCIYQFADNFMTLFRTELENYLISQGFSKDNITIVDGANDQATQTNQIQNFITQGVDVLIINPVNSSSAATITDLVVGADIPLVYINREPDADEEARWQSNGWNVTYVGCDARQ